MEALLMGMALGLFAGLIPGAFSTVVASTALERGLGPGIRVAFLPLLTELPVMLVAVFVLSRLPGGVLRWVGMLGGAILIYMAWRLVRGVATIDPEAAQLKSHMGHYLRVAAFGVLSPSPWAFWFLLGGPLFLNRWNVSPSLGLLFLAAFMVSFIGTMVVLAWLVGTGRRRLNLTWYRRTLRGAGALLLVAGAVLIWQSWIGNFTELVQSPEEFQSQFQNQFQNHR